MNVAVPEVAVPEGVAVEETGRILQLPSHLLQTILMNAGNEAAGAVGACRSLRSSWADALRSPVLLARHILARRGTRLALSYAYCDNVRATFSGHFAYKEEQDRAQQALLQAMVTEGALLHAAAASLLVGTVRAQYLHTLRWLTAPAPAGAGISARRHGADALQVAMTDVRSIPLLAALLAAGANPRTDDSRALIAACTAFKLEACIRGVREQGSTDAADADSVRTVDGVETLGAEEMMGRGTGGGAAAGGAPAGGEESLTAAAAATEADVPLMIVRLLLRHGADPWARGSLCMAEAVRAGNLPLCRELIAAGANVMGADSCALREAVAAAAVAAVAAAPDLSLVNMLLQAGARADARGSEALRSACKPPAAISSSCIVHSSAGYRSTPALTAAPVVAQQQHEGGEQPPQLVAAEVMKGRLGLVKLLLAAGARADGSGNEALSHATEWGGAALPLVRLLLAGGADVNAGGGIALRKACRRGAVEVVEALLAAGAAPDGWSLRATMEGAAAAREALISTAAATIAYAAIHGGAYKVSLPQDGDSKIDAEKAGGEEQSGGRPDGSEQAFEWIVRLLLMAGADPMVDYGQVLLSAVRTGRHRIVAALLEAGARADIYNNVAIQDASRMGWANVVRVLLAAGADPRVNRSAAVTDAAAFGHGAIVTMLVAAGADRRAEMGWLGAAGN